MGSRKSTASLIKRFNEYKLETEFHDGYVVHRTCEWKPLSSSRSWETSTWKQRKVVGSGGSGDVWLQEKEEGEGGGKGGQLRAVKTLLRSSLPDADRSQELLTLVKLNEYNHLFVEFLGWYEDTNVTFFVMEYIELGDLSNYTGGSWAKTGAREVTRQILEGLEVLHGKGICHRDLKPQNILIASLDPVWVKIADFGVAKRVKGTFARTQTGTQGYVAPEVLGVVPRGFKKGFIPHALDIWSLGSLVHELLTSETPFIEPLCDYDSDSVSGLLVGPPERGIDFTSLREYCHGHIGFPTDVLEKSQLNEEGIAFVKSLLIANPKDRPTATRALQNPWLTGYTYTSDSVKKLKNEFSCVGMDLDLGDKEDILMRQVGKGDIMRFLPSSAKVEASTLLMKAAARGYNSVISRLLESPSCGLEPIDSLTKGTLFQLAAQARQLDTIELLLQKKVGIGACIGDQTVLQWVVESGDANTLNLLLEDTADIKTNEGSIGSELLLLATKSGNVDMVRVFLGKNIDINASNGDSQTALQAAAEGGHIDIVKLLLDNKADANVKASGFEGRTALQAAAGGGHIDIVKLLLDNKADVNAEASWPEGRTALQAAAGGGHTDIVKFLLDNKADVNARGSDRTALQVAAGGGYIDTVKLLMDNKADVNAEASWSEGRTALQAAAGGGHIDIVKFLLDNKADVNARGSDRTALQAAAGGGYIDTVKLLLDNKADVNAEASRYEGRTALQAAAGGGHIDTAKFLLDNKADVNAEASGFGGRTSLQAAAEGGYIDTVKFLLDKNADVNARGSDRTAFQAAAGGGHIDTVKLLLDNKADVNAEASRYEGRTALQAAAGGGYIDTVQLLLDNKADVNAEASWTKGRTALQAAAEGGHTDIVKLLLDNKADVNAKASGFEGRMALQAAAEGGYIDTVKFLLDNNADVNGKAGYFGGQTALQVAQQSGNQDIVELLKAFT